MVEFALAAPMVLLLLFGCVELSRILNVYVSLNRVCQKAALQLASPDVTASRPPAAAIRSIRRQIRDPRDPYEWNAAYGPLTVALFRAQPDSSYVEVQVNEEQDGSLFSVVRVQLAAPPMILPTFHLGGRERGFLMVSGRAIAMNETQSLRRGTEGSYLAHRLPISTLLAHPDDPVPTGPVADDSDDAAVFTGFDSATEGDRP